jgi:hypothetical protein
MVGPEQQHDEDDSSEAEGNREAGSQDDQCDYGQWTHRLFSELVEIYPGHAEDYDDWALDQWSGD